MIRRTGIAGLIVILVGVTFLGFATGDHARHVWDKSPRHVTWKTTPGTTPAAASPTALPLAGPVAVTGATVVGPVPARPPFVPPRV